MDEIERERDVTSIVHYLHLYYDNVYSCLQRKKPELFTSLSVLHARASRSQVFAIQNIDPTCFKLFFEVCQTFQRVGAGSLIAAQHRIAAKKKNCLSVRTGGI